MKRMDEVVSKIARIPHLKYVNRMSAVYSMTERSGGEDGTPGIGSNRAQGSHETEKCYIQ